MAAKMPCRVMRSTNSIRGKNVEKIEISNLQKIFTIRCIYVKSSSFILYKYSSITNHQVDKPLSTTELTATTKLKQKKIREQRN